MNITLLGTGTSGGVPSLGCQCPVCRSTDPHDKRLRCVALIETANTRLLIDSGPDIRQQLMPLPFKPIDAVLLTHMHYDHIGGIDDLRAFCTFGEINIYADTRTSNRLHQVMPYCFGRNLYPGVPLLHLHHTEPHKTFNVGDLSITPIRVMHGQMPILGYRIGNFTYITDMKTIADSELPYLQGTQIMVVNALRQHKEHHSHQTLEEAIKFVKRLIVKEAYIIHSSHEIGLHAEVNRMLPEGIYMAYDGMIIRADASSL